MAVLPDGMWKIINQMRFQTKHLKVAQQSFNMLVKLTMVQD